ncbi:kinesin-like protein KIF15 [Frieseomelitta varia]|uniref:kinesin-like protein KIF15 n=1 Tax=Frieseomelitta varia TaxID=561572 RepID=UPI001CB67DEE|nr:kinesin-like protein KIF15 [Frieseomelitta varia]
MENKESVSVMEKSAMSSSGTKSAYQRKFLYGQSGRSSTQGDSASNTTEDTSISNKSQSNSARRTPAKSSVSPISKRLSSTLPAGSTLRPENQYAMKKKRYLLLKKELTDKQKVAQDLYNEMSQLRDKLITKGARDPGKVETLKFEVGSKHFPPAEPSYNEAANVEKLSVGKELLETLEDRLREIPKKLRDFCQELLEKQTNFVAFVTTHLIEGSSEANEPDHANSEVIMKLEVHQRENDALRSRIDEMQEIEEKSIAELTRNVKHLIDEYEHSRAKIKELNAAEAQKELQTQLNATMEELQTEKEKHNQNKDRLRQTESLLQKARTKIREMETQVMNDKEKIQQLQGNMKTMESQMKQKDLAIDTRLKDMQKSMKNNEDLVAKVEKQRDSFEARLVELKEKMNSKENEAMNTIKELSERLKAVTTDLRVEHEKRQHAEDAFVELEERYKNLEDKSKQLCELAEKNKDFTITEGSHTENEVRLFNDLQATKNELEAERQMNLKLQEEKEEIIAVMHQAACREENEDSREKLAAQLVFKSNELQNLMIQYSELKKIAKNAQEKNGILEKQLIDIQTRLHSQSMEGGRAGLSAHAIELQQQVSDLRNNLVEVIQQKEELETALSQKHLELEQRDRVMREQSKFLKVRDELLDILKGKAQQENGELSNSNENNEYLEQIATKTEAIQELYTTLENKQLQIMRLEKMVKLMEDHQDRAQAQRTRLENRIAQLELALQRNKEQRYLHNYGDYTQRQTSSDEDQPYICERCRQETFAEKNEPWLSKNDSTENIDEFSRNWLPNASSLEIDQNSMNIHDFQNNKYFYDSPSIDRNRKYISRMYNLHGEFDNIDDSSRESQNPYQREYYQYHHLHRRVRSPLVNRTVPHGVNL